MIKLKSLLGLFNSAKKQLKSNGEEDNADNADITGTFENAALIGASSDAVQRHGAAVKEFLTAYSGVDNETGQTASRSLKKIFQSKVNSEYINQNLKQQAGFSAEVLDVARSNAAVKIKGDGIRITRTDDMVQRIDKNFGEIGGTNDQLYDRAVIDAHGKVIDTSQMKFVGNNAKEALTKLKSGSYQKYIEHNVRIRVPSDYYDAIKQEISKEEEKLLLQESAARSKGKIDVADKHRNNLEKLRKINKNLEKSNVSSQEAMLARLNPKWTVDREIINTGHNAGIETAKYGAILSGGVSAVRNFVAVFSGEKDLGDAAVEIIWDAGKGTIVSYITGFSGSVVAGAMKNSTSKMMQAVSKSSLPAAIAMSLLETGKTLCKYFDGDIDGIECLEELGEKGTGMLGAGAMATVGQTLIPVPVVGALLGAMIGYTLSNGYYQCLLSALKEAKFAKEMRMRIERECEESIRLIRECREKTEKIISQYLSDHITAFNSALDVMNIALKSGKAEDFIAGANSITRKLGGKVLFDTMDEFDAFMRS